MLLSITVVHHCNRVILENCLDSIFRETRGIDFEIILVDNCSNEGIATLIKQKYPKIRLIENEQPAGFASNQNKALKVANGGYVLILNDDTVILDSAINKMVSFIAKNPSIGLLGCKIYKSGQGNARKQISNVPTKYLPTPLREFFDTFMGLSGIRRMFPNSSFLYSFGWSDSGPNACDNAMDVAHIGGACMLARREVIEEVGLFDENYFMFVEETDWCYRIRQKGYKIYYYPYASIIHYGANSFQQVTSDRRQKIRERSLPGGKQDFQRQRKKVHEQSLNYFFRKHYGAKGFYLHRFLRTLLYPLFVIRGETWKKQVTSDKRQEYLELRIGN